MNIQKNLLDDHQIELTVEFDQETFEGYKRRAARKISRETKIQGFRPGKAPMNVVKRMVGEEYIQTQAVEILIDEVYPKVLDEAEISPSGPGSVKDVPSMDPPTLVFVVPLMPEIELCDFLTMRKEYNYEEVSDDEFNEVIENMRKSMAIAEPVDRAAEVDDVVSIKISGKAVDSDDEDEVLPDRPMQVTIAAEDSDQPDSYPFEGFSKELVGLKTGESKVITHQFDEDIPSDQFKGKNIEFSVEVDTVKTQNLPDLDDEFATSIGDYENLEDMNTKVREEMSAARENEYEQTYISEFVDSIVENSTLKYPPHLLEEEIESVIKNLENQIGMYNMDLETYFKVRNTDREKFIEEEAHPVAVQRLERSLILDEIARKEEVKLEEDQLQNEVTNMMNQFMTTPGFELPKSNQKMKEFSTMVSYDAATRLLNQNVMDRLKLIATGEYTAERTSEEAETSNEDTEVEKEETAADDVISNEKEDSSTAE